jgi:hypothetical protein
MFKFIALTVLFALSGTDAFFKCCSNQPNAVCPTAVTSPSCSGLRCTLSLGQQLTADVTFTPVKVHQRLDVSASTTALGVTVPITPPQVDACTTLFLDGKFAGCPTTPNVPYVWKIVYLVPNEVTAVLSANIQCKFFKKKVSNFNFCKRIKKMFTCKFQVSKG